eukprot:scaffold1311_cov256-Pinguiococcus_pyrenoidosus.AAC.52
MLRYLRNAVPSGVRASSDFLELYSADAGTPPASSPQSQKLSIRMRHEQTSRRHQAENGVKRGRETPL